MSVIPEVEHNRNCRLTFFRQSDVKMAPDDARVNVDGKDVKPIKVTARLISTMLAVNVMFVAYGCLAGYPSPAVPNINENPNPFRLDADAQSWASSLIGLGSFAGAFTCGSTIDYLGRKLALMISAALCVISLTVITASGSAIQMFIGCFCSGFTSIVNFTACLLYVSEIAPTQVRGRLTMTYAISYALGTFSVYVVGAFIPWNWLAVFDAALYATPILVMVFVPESPRWLLLKGQRQNAIDSFVWFCGSENTDKVMEEIRLIEESLDESRKEKSSSWIALLERNNLKNLAVCCFIFFIQDFSGVFVLQLNSVIIFEKAGLDNLDPNLQAVITGFFFLLGSSVCPLVVDRFGRRPLLIVSTAIVGICMAASGAFFLVEEHDDDYARRHLFWLPVAALSLGTFSFATGLLPVPYLLACELFPTKVRGKAQTAGNLVLAGMSFVCLKSFVNIEAAIHISGAFFLYASVCAIGTLFVVFVLKEPSREALQ